MAILKAIMKPVYRSVTNKKQTKGKGLFVPPPPPHPKYWTLFLYEVSHPRSLNSGVFMQYAMYTNWIRNFQKDSKMIWSMGRTMAWFRVAFPLHVKIEGEGLTNHSLSAPSFSCFRFNSRDQLVCKEHKTGHRTTASLIKVHKQWPIWWILWWRDWLDLWLYVMSASLLNTGDDRMDLVIASEQWNEHIWLAQDIY